MVTTTFEYKSQGRNLKVTAKAKKITLYGAEKLHINLYDEFDNEIELGDLPFDRKGWEELEEHATNVLVEEYYYPELVY